MDTIIYHTIKHVIAKYDELIAELESISERNTALINEANKNPDSTIVREWAKFAKENIRRLKIAKAERDSLQQNYFGK